MRIFTLGVVILGFIGYSAAVDTANGERVGGCPSSGSITNPGSARDTQCVVDTDCTGHKNQKCCPGEDGIKVCVNPEPACQDGTRLRPWSLLRGSCEEMAGTHCIDRGCEDGPSGPGGWTAGCCGGYAFEWTGAPHPTCGNGTGPLKDSEGEIFWCGIHSVRSCPANSACVEDASGYKICCPTSVDTSGSGEVEPETSTSPKPPQPPRPDCNCANEPSCPYGLVPDHDSEECCKYICVEPVTPPECAVVRCAAPICPDGARIHRIAGTCCEYMCIPPPPPKPDCSRVLCADPRCPDGATADYIPETCCEYICVASPTTLPTAEPTTVPTTPGSRPDPCGRVTCFPRPTCEGGRVVESPGRCCTLYDCVLEPLPKAVCTPGSWFNLPEYPCMSCLCGEDGRPSEDCAEMACDIRECPAGQWGEYIPGTCCGFNCVDIIPQPSEGPDVDVCSLPLDGGVCRAYIPSWGYDPTTRGCETFIYGGCDGNDNRFHTKEECENRCGGTDKTKVGPKPEPGCVNENKEPIAVGEYYTSPTKPCETCRCAEDGEFKCVSALCSEPTCPFGQTVELLKNTCCGFKCVVWPFKIIGEDGYLTQFGLNIVLGTLLIIVIIIAIATACYYRRKNRRSTLHFQNYYCNLAHSDSKESTQNPKKVENVYEQIGVGNNDMNKRIEKEKEALQSVLTSV